MPIHPSLFAIQDELVFQKIRRDKFKDIPFLDFHNFAATTIEYGDLEHLNHVGAKRFSIMLNNLISDGLLNDSQPQKKIDLALKSAIFDSINTQINN